MIQAGARRTGRAEPLPGARTTRTRGRDRVRRAIYLGCLLAALGGLLYVQISPTFRVRHIAVDGQHFASPEQVIAFSGLSGQNPFRVQSGPVRQRVLDTSIPADVWVTFQLPDTAVVHLRERQPAFWWQVGPTVYLVALDGTVLGPADKPVGSFVVEDADRRPVGAGDHVDPRTLREASLVVSSLPASVGPAPHRVLASAKRGIVVVTADGISIAFGDDENLTRKLAVLTPVLGAARSATPRPTFVDLSVVDHPYFR